MPKVVNLDGKKVEMLVRLSDITLVAMSAFYLAAMMVDLWGA